MTLTRLLIASGADRNYFPLLRDAVLSIRALRRDVAIGVLDLGLDESWVGWVLVVRSPEGKSFFSIPVQNADLACR